MQPKCDLLVLQITTTRYYCYIFRLHSTACTGILNSRGDLFGEIVGLLKINF